MGKFTVYGPFPIAFDKKGKKRIIRKPDNDFWESNPDFEKLQGCYVYGIKNGNVKPYYVGLATKSFKQEIFTSHKLTKYNDVLFEYEKGTPVIFLIAHPIQKGKTNNKEIKEIENFLIQVGLTINNNIRNIKGTKKQTWEIKNVVGSGSGRPNESERKFKKMFGI